MYMTIAKFFIAHNSYMYIANLRRKNYLTEAMDGGKQHITLGGQPLDRELH